MTEGGETSTSTPAAPQDQGFLVQRTTAVNREAAKGQYLICCNAQTKRDRRLGRYAVVSRTLEQPGQEPRELRAVGKVHVSEEVAATHLALDQSIRNAIGIKFHFDEISTYVGVNPTTVPPCQRFRTQLVRALGTRYLYLRASLADIPDMEKNLVRIPPEAFMLLGMKPGNKVLIETVTPLQVVDGYGVTSTSVCAYELTPEIVERRRDLQDPSLGAQYPDPEELLDLAEDIWPIYIDDEERHKLGRIRPLDVVKVRRNYWDLFLDEILGFGIVFFISLISLSNALSIDVGPALVMSLVIAVVLVLFNLRARSGA